MDMNQLQQVEILCNNLYLGTSTQLRNEAQQQLLQLQSSSDFIPQCQYILDNSQQPYAQLLASNSLETLITLFWNNFTNEQKLEIRNYILNYLANHSNNLQDFVIGSLTKLVCRITKLGWFDDVEHRELVTEVTKFLQGTIDHNFIGLRILSSLVDEMNIPTSGRTLTQHRKVAVSFRDNSLFSVFQIALTTLKHIQSKSISVTNEQEKKLCQISLTLVIACLSFDFIGTNPEESPEDVGTVQVPSSWRPIVQDTSTMELLFHIYLTNTPPRSNQAMEAIVQLSSIRRSLFAVEKERQVFLDYLMKQIHDIMQSKQGLDEVENYHEFCRLLGRLKASYQLSELVKTRGFADWLILASDFTIKSLFNWQYSMNSIHYLLALWSRLVAALPYLRPDTVQADHQMYSHVLKQSVMQVIEAYIETMLNSVEIVVDSDGDIEDPLEDEGALKEQMEKLPTLVRLQYETIAQYLLNVMQNDLTTYENIINQAGNHSTQSLPNTTQRQIRILEGRLTWITQIVAAVVGSQPSGSSITADNRKDQIFDGQLSRCVFMLLQMIDFRMNSTEGQGKTSEQLEIAFLRFFQAFKRSYLLDTSVIGSPLGIGGISSIQSVPGGESAHPLLSLALSYTGDSQTMGNETVSIYDTMGLGDITSIMNIIVCKICNNIRFWNRSDEILEGTLEVFVDLISSYSSSKTLLSLDMVNFMVHNHVGTHFPFLSYDNDNKYRITFYTALSRLVFTAAEDLNNSFDTFIAPKLDIIHQLNLTQNLSDFSAKVAIISICRDFRGISTATTSKRTYNLLFDVLYPDFFTLLKRASEVWCADPNVMTAILKFLQEFVFNKSQRIYFEQSSANGILLFRETSAIVCTYGSRVLEIPVVQDIYTEKYKGIRLMLNVLTCALSGGYVNFGVFALYEDKALQNALDVSLQMCLQIPLNDILAYMKLSKAYFGYLEVLMKGHLDVLCGLDSSVFITLIKTLHEGLQSSDASVCALCATAIDHLFTYIFLNLRRDKPTVQMIRSHIASEPDLPDQLMATLFNTLLFATQANHWAITRPILSLMLAFESSFNSYRDSLLQNQPEENQQKLMEEFEKLTSDIQTSVETSNRDRFTQKLTLFRLSVRQFLTF